MPDRPPTRVLLGDATIGAQAERFRALLGAEFEVVAPEAFDAGALVAQGPRTEVLVAHRYAPGFLEAATELRLMQLWIAGADEIDLEPLRARGIAVATAHENGRSVAQHALGLLLAVMRRIPQADRRLRQGDWSLARLVSPPRPSLDGKTAVLLGLGSAGKSFLDLLRPFGPRVLAVRNRPDREPPPDGVERVVGPDQLSEVLAQADVVVVLLPHTPATHHLLDEAALRRLPPHAYLVQVGRAEIIPEAALYRACSEGWIAGAGVDVWYRYPPPAPCPPSRLPFGELDNVVMSPHVAGWTDDVFPAQVRFVAENLRRFRVGEPLRHLYDYELGY